MPNKAERLTLFISADLNSELRVEAARHRKTLSAVATEAFTLYLSTRATDRDSKPAPVEEDQDGPMSFAPAVA